MNGHIILELEGRHVIDFQNIQKRNAHAFDGLRKEYTKLLTVWIEDKAKGGNAITYRYNGGVLDVHVENRKNPLLINPKSHGRIDLVNIDGAVEVKMDDGNCFDFQARIEKKGQEHRFTIIKTPKSKLRQRWLVADSGSVLGGKKLSNAWYLITIYTVAHKIVSYLPFALTSRTLNDGSLLMKPAGNFTELAEKGILEYKKAEYLKHRFDGWDVISLEFDEFAKILNYGHDGCCLKSFDEIPLKRFALRVYDKHISEYGGELVIKYTADRHTGRLGFECTVKRDIDRKLTGSFSVEKIDNPLTGDSRLEYALEGEYKPDSSIFKPCGNEEDSPTTVEVIRMGFDAVSAFMLRYGDVATEVEERQCQNQTEGKSGKRQSRNSVRLFKTYTLAKGWKRKVERKKAEIRCLAWGVRGHFRHYKNGKVIFVESYVKGKERDKYAGKDYVLLPHAE